MSDSIRRGPVLALATALVALLVLGAAPVLAHAELVASDPADGASVATPPTTITLTFSEGLVAKRSSFQLTQAGQPLGTGKAAADGDTTMTLGGLSLGAGDYVIQWTSVAEDGDLLRGKLSFTVLEPTAAPSTAAPTATATPIRTDDNSGPPPSTAAISPSPQPSSDAAPASSSGSDVLLPIVLGLLVLAAVGGFLFSRTRRA